MVLVSSYGLISLFLLFGGLIFLTLGFLFFLESSIILVEWLLMDLGSSGVVYTIIFDWMSLVFVGTVFFISCCVFLYSYDYMWADFYFSRFIFLVLSFVFFMVLLILSFNLMGVLLGWDGLGLTSYCLIIYYHNESSQKAGMLTALMNRLGDAFLIVGVCWMLNYGSWQYMFYSDSFFSGYLMYFLVIAGFTSSAQIPFSSWLPAAMAAPTPVSALVHSSTLVTAGIYLLIRFHSSLESLGTYFFVVISLLTMLMASVCALVEFDMSSVVALSTLSQLGLMMSCLALGFPNLSFFHLLVHALFSSLMFLCVGVYIHACDGNQDLRSVGLVFVSYPLVSTCFCIASFSLGAMPFISAYYSSDLIMEVLSMGNVNLVVCFVFYLSACLTLIYIFRMGFYLLLFVNVGGGVHKVVSLLSATSLSIIFISLATIPGGNFFLWLILDKPVFVILPSFVSGLPLILLGLGLLVVLDYLGSCELEGGRFLYFISSFNGFMWFMPVLGGKVSFFIVGRFYWLGYSLNKGWLEMYGPQGVVSLLNNYSRKHVFLNYNSIKLFMFWVLVLTVVFVLLV